MGILGENSKGIKQICPSNLISRMMNVLLQDLTPNTGDGIATTHEEDYILLVWLKINHSGPFFC